MFKSGKYFALELVLIVLSAGLFALTHVFNGWVFHFFEFSNHISWVYLPAFLRLLYVLVLGRVNGFIAILLGSLILNFKELEEGWIWMANSLCSAAAPVIACTFLMYWRRRRIDLSALRDLLELTVIYCVVNALIHHLVWVALDPTQLRETFQILTMMAGDFVGCLMGVGLMKSGIDRFGLPGTRSSFRGPFPPAN